MYLLFKYKGIMPSDFYFKGSGEKRIIRAFLIKELEERASQLAELELR